MSSRHFTDALFNRTLHLIPWFGEMFDAMKNHNRDIDEYIRILDHTILIEDAITLHGTESKVLVSFRHKDILFNYISKILGTTMADIDHTYLKKLINASKDNKPLQKEDLADYRVDSNYYVNNPEKFILWIILRIHLLDINKVPLSNIMSYTYHTVDKSKIRHINSIFYQYCETWAYKRYYTNDYACKFSWPAREKDAEVLIRSRYLDSAKSKSIDVLDEDFDLLNE